MNFLNYFISKLTDSDFMDLVIIGTIIHMLVLVLVFLLIAGHLQY